MVPEKQTGTHFDRFQWKKIIKSKRITVKEQRIEQFWVCSFRKGFLIKII